MVTRSMVRVTRPKISSRSMAKMCRGSIVRFGPNTISFNTIEAVREIYTNRQSNVQKAPWYTVIEASAGGGNSIHAETDRRIHASHRRVMEHAFKEKSLKESEVYLVQNVLAFCNIVDQTSKSEEGWSKPFNMSEWSTYLNYDIMGDLVFGKQFNAMTSDAHRFVPKLIMNSTTFIYTVSLALHCLPVSIPEISRSLRRCLIKLSLDVCLRADFSVSRSLAAKWQKMTNDSTKSRELLSVSASQQKARGRHAKTSCTIC